jgi:hypothetical protein
MKKKTKIISHAKRKADYEEAEHLPDDQTFSLLVAYPELGSPLRKLWKMARHHSGVKGGYPNAELVAQALEDLIHDEPDEHLEHLKTLRKEDKRGDYYKEAATLIKDFGLVRGGRAAGRVPPMPKMKTTMKKKTAKTKKPKAKKVEVVTRKAPPIKSVQSYLQQARAERRREMAQAQASCKANREAVKARFRARFDKLKLALKSSLERAEREDALSCRARKQAIDSSYHSKAQRAALLRDEKKRQAAERAALQSKRKATASQLKALNKARETRQEQLERARHEVQAQAPNLLALFDEIKTKLRLKPGFTSLAEVFFQFAHDNPEHVIASAQSRANKAAAKEIRDIAKGTAFERVSGTICNKAERAFKTGRPFVLKQREEAALRALGKNPDDLMRTCYPSHRRRVVSGRDPRKAVKASETPF